MQMYGGVNIQPCLLNRDTRWRWVVNFTSQPCYPPQGKNPSTHWAGGWLSPRAVFTLHCGHEKNLSWLLIKTQSSSPQPSHYTDWATPTHLVSQVYSWNKEMAKINRSAYSREISSPHYVLSDIKQCSVLISQPLHIPIAFYTQFWNVIVNSSPVIYVACKSHKSNPLKFGFVTFRKCYM